METTKKFWCHYIGNDGNTPKRRSIELVLLSELLPRLKIKCSTPLWCERKEEQPYSITYVYYNIYAQLDDKVAVDVPWRLRDVDIESLLQTDEDFKAWGEKVWADDLASATTDEDRQRLISNRDNVVASRIEQRERGYESLKLYANFDVYLLSKAKWINKSILRAYDEANSPLLPTLQVLRKVFEAEREEQARKRKEETKKHAEEEARKKAEAKAKEQERLIQEAEKFRKGEYIKGEDVVTLCRLYGINIHLRTVHNLLQVIVDINSNGQCHYWKTNGKRRPQLDGCYLTAAKLYKYLQSH